MAIFEARSILVDSLRDADKSEYAKFYRDVSLSEEYKLQFKQVEHMRLKLFNGGQKQVDLDNLNVKMVEFILDSLDHINLQGFNVNCEKNGSQDPDKTKSYYDFNSFNKSRLNNRLKTQMNINVFNALLYNYSFYIDCVYSSVCGKSARLLSLNCKDYIRSRYADRFNSSAFNTNFRVKLLLDATVVQMFIWNVYSAFLLGNELAGWNFSNLLSLPKIYSHQALEMSHYYMVHKTYAGFGYNWDKIKGWFPIFDLIARNSLANKSFYKDRQRKETKENLEDFLSLETGELYLNDYGKSYGSTVWFDTDLDALKTYLLYNKHANLLEFNFYEYGDKNNDNYSKSTSTCKASCYNVTSADIIDEIYANIDDSTRANANLNEFEQIDARNDDSNEFKEFDKNLIHMNLKDNILLDEPEESKYAEVGYYNSFLCYIYFDQLSNFASDLFAIKLKTKKSFRECMDEFISIKYQSILFLDNKYNDKNEDKLKGIDKNTEAKDSYNSVNSNLMYLKIHETVRVITELLDDSYLSSIRSNSQNNSNNMDPNSYQQNSQQNEFFRFLKYEPCKEPILNNTFNYTQLIQFKSMYSTNPEYGRYVDKLNKLKGARILEVGAHQPESMQDAIGQSGFEFSQLFRNLLKLKEFSNLRNSDHMNNRHNLKLQQLKYVYNNETSYYLLLLLPLLGVEKEFKKLRLVVADRKHSLCNLLSALALLAGVVPELFYNVDVLIYIHSCSYSNDVAIHANKDKLVQTHSAVKYICKYDKQFEKVSKILTDVFMFKHEEETTLDIKNNNLNLNLNYEESSNERDREKDNYVSYNVQENQNIIQNNTDFKHVINAVYNTTQTSVPEKSENRDANKPEFTRMKYKEPSNPLAFHYLQAKNLFRRYIYTAANSFTVPVYEARILFNLRLPDSKRNLKLDVSIPFIQDLQVNSRQKSNLISLLKKNKLFKAEMRYRNVDGGGGVYPEYEIVRKNLESISIAHLNPQSLDLEEEAVPEYNRQCLQVLYLDQAGLDVEATNHLFSQRNGYVRLNVNEMHLLLSFGGGGGEDQNGSGSSKKASGSLVSSIELGKFCSKVSLDGRSLWDWLEYKLMDGDGYFDSDGFDKNKCSYSKLLIHDVQFNIAKYKYSYEKQNNKKMTDTYTTKKKDKESKQNKQENVETNKRIQDENDINFDINSNFETHELKIKIATFLDFDQE